MTIGCEFLAKNLLIKEHNIRIQLWDTAGEESFRSITRSYYKNSTCAFIVYDITSRKTFENIVIWLGECRDMCYKDVLIILVGNKCDLEGKRAVSVEEGQKFANDNQLLFFETSAKNGTNIEEIFTESASILIDKIESGQIKLDSSDNGIKIGKYPKKGDNGNNVNTKRKCC